MTWDLIVGIISMGRITRRLKRFKGVIGEGFHGKTYSVPYEPKGESLYNLLSVEDITKVTLLTEDVKHPYVMEGKVEVAPFLAFLRNLQGVIAKVFKETMIYRGVSIEEDMLEEVAMNRKVIQIYGKHAKKFLTVLPIRGFRRVPFFASVIEIVGKKPLYITYASICNNKFKFEPLRFAKEALESIEILQKGGYQHNDIKMDNFVLCADRYKLIDWGQAGPIGTFMFGDMISSSPMKWYIAGVPAFFSDRIMNFRARTTDVGYEESDIFQHVYERLEDEFFYVTGGGYLPVTKELVDKYKKSFDIFMVGMTMLRGIYLQGLDFQMYKPTIDALTSLTNPITSPKEAIRIVTSHT
jgi:serine/threonine protein kinase